MKMGSKKIRDVVINAAEDYKYLLDRGYNQAGALELVTSRYLLNKEEKVLLYRCVHSRANAYKVKLKTASISSLSKNRLIIDGYNVLLTITSGVEGRNLYLCDDGFVRDLRSTKVHDFSSPSIVEAIKYLSNFLKEINPLEVIVYLDRNVSWSAKHAETIKKNAGIPITVELVSKADTSVIRSKGITASSDYLVLERATSVFDLAGHIVKKRFKDQLDASIYLLFQQES